MEAKSEVPVEFPRGTQGTGLSGLLGYWLIARDSGIDASCSLLKGGRLPNVYHSR